MSRTLIKDVTVVNEDQVRQASVLIDNDIIADIINPGESCIPFPDQVIDAKGRWLLPGAIDDHVHFREPGLTHKADMASESRAAAAGGVTSVFDMPNCIPQTVSLQALEDKYLRASECCLVNYSFYLGATRDNIKEIERLDAEHNCGVKLFMGSSTGGMLLDDRKTLKTLFSASHVPIAVHCEDNSIINTNMDYYTRHCGGEPPVQYHPLIRSEEACYASTAKALDVASETDVHLHILHITTARELLLFEKGPLQNKRFTAEACPAHLWFTDADYITKGTLIKCNPAIKTAADRDALRQALTDGRIDVIGTDHAPHLFSEKQGGCRMAASGMPVLPYSLPLMLELTNQGMINLTDVTRLMCHNPALLFKVSKRGFIRKGFKADLTLISYDKEGWTAGTDNNPTKCGCSPFEGERFHWKVDTTWINGHTVYDDGRFDTEVKGQQIRFQR